MACMGIVTVSCTAASGGRHAAPSQPRMMAVGSHKSSCGSGVPPRGTAATRRTRRSRADAMTSESEPRAAIGRRNVPPIAPRSAFQPNGSAEPSIATTPDAPKAAAARMIAPTFPGSCSPARTRTSGRSVTVAITTRTSAGRAKAIATTPDACCTGLIAASTWSLTTRTRPPRSFTSLAIPTTGERELLSCRSENAAISTGMSQKSASRTRCSPSSRTSVMRPGRAAGSDPPSLPPGCGARPRSRNRFTIAF